MTPSNGASTKLDEYWCFKCNKTWDEKTCKNHAGAKRVPLEYRLREIIDNWVLSLADEYDSASPRIKKFMEDNPASEEEWEAVLNPILQLFKQQNAGDGLLVQDLIDQAYKSGWEAAFFKFRESLPEKRTDAKIEDDWKDEPAWVGYNQCLEDIKRNLGVSEEDK